MEFYLFKSVACLAIFWMFYKLLLERTNVHNLKRIYLLFSLTASLLIPFITFTQYIEVTPVEPSVFSTSTVIEGVTYEIQKKANYLPIILWSLYGFGVLFFLLKFSRNLFRLGQRIKKNPKFKNKNVFHVLLKPATIPHTFLHYIFLNQKEYHANSIPKEILLHEETHAKQLHSLDILFIELLQIVFWFNPLILVMKHSIKLNHEFLADRAVLNQGIDTFNYQNLLLSFSSNAEVPILANSINYSSFKKRLTVMKTKTSKQGIWLRSILLLPLLAGLVYGFSSTKEVETNLTETPYDEIGTPKDYDFNEPEKTVDSKLLVNGIECDKCLLTLPKSDIKDLLLETNTGKDIESFKIKIPRNIL